MKIPPPSDSTVSRIFKSWEAREKPSNSRRLGASQIGRPCDRELWYSFHWAKLNKFEGRMLRLFEKGRTEESWIELDLKEIGVEFLELDAETGKQWEFSELGDHFVCKLDGAACGFIEAAATWHVVEIKTANQSAFDKVVKEGCKKAKPEHYAQMITGMGMSGMDRAAYIVVNKNTEEIYFERITMDKTEWKRILQRAKEIIFGDIPERINESAAWYQCKFCNFNSICHECGECAAKNCRTCGFATSLEAGGWACDDDNTVIPIEKQKIGCDKHQFRNGMIPTVAEDVLNVFGGKIVDEENLSV